MSALSDPLPAEHRCQTWGLGQAVAIDMRTIELLPRYGFRLAHEIAHREQRVRTEADRDELRAWVEMQA